MVDACATTTDVPLDAASAGAVASLEPRVPASALTGRTQALAAAPIPRRHEFAAPYAPAPRFRRCLLVHIRLRIPPVRQGPALTDEPRIDVPAAVPAHRDDATVSIPVALAASHRPAADLAGECPGSALPAGPALASGKTALLALGGIDPMQTHPHGADFYRVAVDHPRPPRQIRVGRRGPWALGTRTHDFHLLVHPVGDPPNHDRNRVERVSHRIAAPQLHGWR